MPNTSLVSVRQNLIALRIKNTKWREIGEMYPGVPLGTLCRIAKDNSYTPKSHKILSALGLRHPRRCYDLSDKEARRIAVNILGIIHG